MAASEQTARRPSNLKAVLTRGVNRGTLAASLVVFTAVYVGAAPLSDNSFFTHLTTGELILHGHLPTRDPYSFTAHGAPWVVQSWFASLLYASSERIGHGVGLRLMIAALSGILAALLWRLGRPARSLVTRLVAVSPAVIVGYVAWGPRPLLFGLVGFALLLVVLLEERDPRWMVPIMWVWVNTHGSFPLAFVVTIVFAVGTYCDSLPTEHAFRTLKWSILGMLVGAINPLGPKLLWFPVQLLSKQDVLRYMVEWQAPSFEDTWQRIFLVTALAGLALTPRLSKGRRYRLLLPFLAFFALALTAERNIPMASFLLVPMLATELGDLGRMRCDERSRPYSFLCLFIAVVAVTTVGTRFSAPTFDFSTYPVASVDWLRLHGRFGDGHHVAHQDVVGNYIELWSSGRAPVFVDDRVDMFPRSVVVAETILVRGGASWEDVLTRWKVDTVLWEKGQPLATLLGASKDWRLVHVEHTPTTSWEIFERVTRRGS